MLNTIADVFFNGASGLNVQSGDDVQVSRLGMPLVNEAVIPRALKDAFNTLTPEQDLVVFARQDDRIPQEVSGSAEKERPGSRTAAIAEGTVRRAEPDGGRTHAAT